MKLAVMQPYFLPYIGYFQAINEVDKYILYENLSFIKDGWINRNKILIKNGAEHKISVPLLSKSSNILIKDVKIDNTQQWREKMLKTFFLNYKGSNHFDEVFSFFENLFDKDFESISELNAFLIISICNFIGIKTEIEYNNFNKYEQLEEKLIQIDKNDYSDFMYMEKTKPLKKVARVLELSKIENADYFVNAIGGLSLYSKEEFIQYGIKLNFVKTSDFTYKQFTNSFVPNLSILDVLMHNGKEGTLRLIKKYQLV